MIIKLIFYIIYIFSIYNYFKRNLNELFNQKITFYSSNESINQN